MNLQTHVSDRLWMAIAAPYESGNFSHAVLESIHFLTDVLRDKAGIDGDGAALVGQALGGDAPKLRINAFQTETEKNTQRGIEQLLRGIYLAIRNPRSHEQFTDTQADAEAIIHFLDYVIRIVDRSKESFTIGAFIAAVCDSEFVESQRYAELIVAEIPSGRRADALIALFEIRGRVALQKIRYVVSHLLTLLNEAQRAQYLSVISEEFRTTSDAAGIRTAFQMMSPELWSRISEASRLRIENKVIKEMRLGRIDDSKGKVTGAFATWASHFMRRFDLRPECAGVLLGKLDSWDEAERHYVATYFFGRLPEILTDEAEIKGAVRSIADAIRSKDHSIRMATLSHTRTFPSDWQAQLADALLDLTNPANPGVVLNDGTPLLEADATTEISDDDIPF